MDQQGHWWRRPQARGDPQLAGLLALREYQESLPPLWQFIFQARIRRARFDLAMRKRRLTEGVKQLEEFDRLLASFEGDDEDEGDEPLSPYRFETRFPELSRLELRNALHGVFENLLAKDADKDWSRTDEGLRVPTASAVNAELTDLGFDPLSDEGVKNAYIAYLNGD